MKKLIATVADLKQELEDAPNSADVIVRITIDTTTYHLQLTDRIHYPACDGSPELLVFGTE